jgi:hypothetical protein
MLYEYYSIVIHLYTGIQIHTQEHTLFTHLPSSDSYSYPRLSVGSRTLCRFHGLTTPDTHTTLEGPHTATGTARHNFTGSCFVAECIPASSLHQELARPHAPTPAPRERDKWPETRARPRLRTTKVSPQSAREKGPRPSPRWKSKVRRRV